MRRMMLLPLAVVASTALLAAVPAAAATPSRSGLSQSGPAQSGQSGLQHAASHPAEIARAFATAGPAFSPLPDVYPVGKTMGFTVDTARGVAARYPNPASSVRNLPISIWYPAANGATSSGDTFWAPARAGHFPLIVFAAGYNSNPETYQPFLHAIAAQGYIVAAPLFPIEAAIDGAAPAGRSNTEILNQMYDMSATITQMVSYANTSGNFLSWAMNATNIGVIGHSDGAMTVAGMTMSTSFSDPRIKAVAVMAGAGPMGLSWNKRKVVPTMVEQATQDPYNSPSNSDWLFNAVTGSRDYLTVSGYYHIWPLIGDDAVADATRRSVIDHFNGVLKNGGLPSLWQLLTDGNTAGITSLRFAT